MSRRPPRPPTCVTRRYVPLDRSERIRTYNFPENRIVDHRTNYKAYNLDAVLDGDLQAVIDSDIQADEADRLANQQ